MGRGDKWLPRLTAAGDCPKYGLGPKQPNLALNNTQAEAMATSANENTKLFQISPASYTLHRFPTPGIKAPLGLLLHPRLVEIGAILSLVIFHPSWLGPPGIGSASSSSTPGSSALESFPSQALVFRKMESLQPLPREKCGATGKTSYSPDSVS